jgi:D-sedoheptulose 7-phosphate isomerase
MTVPVRDLVRRLPALATCEKEIEGAIDLLRRSLLAGGKVLVCGNGGSFADSQHLVADLMKGFMSERPVPVADRQRLEALGERGRMIGAVLQGGLPALALGAEGPLATAIANDIEYDMVFAQQLNALGRAGDVLMAISTSGNSASVIHAACVARLRDVAVIALTGRDGGEIAALADIAIRVPADRVFEIQELHLPTYHAIALALEQFFFPDPTSPDGTSAPPPGVAHHLHGRR